MNTKTKKLSSSLALWFTLAIALVFAPNLWAQCNGTIYFKAPADWSEAHVYFNRTGDLNNRGVATLNAATGYYEVTVNDAFNGYIFMKTASPYNTVTVVNAGGYNYSVNAQANTATLTCPTGGGTWYVSEDPLNPGKTYQGANPPEAKYIYFMVPEEPTWMSAVPMLSTDGGVTGTPMRPDPDRCGWYYAVFESDAAPSSAVFYRDDDTAREDVVGADGLWGDGSVTPVPLDLYFTVLGDILFFIPDDAAWPDYADLTSPTPGFFATDPLVEGTCSYSLAAVIYDTDEDLHPGFSSYNGKPSPCREGVMTGLVEPLLGPDNKPVPTAQGISCFGGGDAFNNAFRPTAGVNEVTCYDLPFTRSSDGKWEFDSDYAETDGLNGGFYPVENTTDADVLATGMGTPLATARMKRNAEPPVALKAEQLAIDPVEQVPVFDLYCNTPGWKGGIDCGAAVPGQPTYNYLGNGEYPAVWNWEIRPVVGRCWGVTNPDGKCGAGNEAPRNQHYCFESRANFVHKPGLNFTFRGDDDIWVFIDKRLAVDLGGTHLAAPGYVKLDSIKDRNGANLVPGQTYDIDIFFCDRRTTMSNVRIKTNMYIQQSSGLDYQSVPEDPNIYELCYETSGDGSCATMALGGGSGSTSTRVCGSAIGKPVSYEIVKRNGEPVVSLPNAQIYYGGIDLTDRYRPKVDKAAIGGLPPGNYRLLISIEGKTTSISFRIAGNLNVMTRDSKSEETGRTWRFRGSAMAGIRIPVYISAFADNGPTLPLDVDEESAVGQTYSLDLSDGLRLYSADHPDSILTESAVRTIGSSGMDTVWVTVLVGSMTDAASAAHTVKVVGRTAVANLTFYLPAIAFVDSTYSTRVVPSGTKFFTDSDDPEDSWTLIRYPLYLVAYDPTLPENDPALGTIQICEDCNFSLSYEFSPGLSTPGSTSIIGGKADIGLMSRTLYADPNFAEIKVMGDNNPLISATWNQLQFFKPPFPTPLVVELFDNEGEMEDLSGAMDAAYVSPSGSYLDGIADSLVIVYDRLIHKDSLPDSILVFWDYDEKGVLDTFRLDRSAIEAAKVEKNAEFWDSVFVFKGKQFSKTARTTSPFSTIESWIRYKKGSNTLSAGPAVPISEKVPPIILSTRITAERNNFDRVRLVFSEPLANLTAAQESQALELFHYYLRSANVATAAQRYVAVLAGSGSWRTSRDTVDFFYANENQASSPSPHAGDYVRFRAGFLTDSLGNAPTDYNALVPSPWIQIVGDARSEIWSVKFAEIDPTDPEMQKRIEKGEVETPHHVGLYESLDSIKARFPGQLGYVIKTDMANILSSDTSLMRLDPKDIWLVTETFYYTNLGTFVAEGGSRKIACDDPLFNGDPLDNKTKGDCRTHPGYVFLGWNLLAHNKRLVGTGAYIAKLSTYVQIRNAGRRAKHDVTEIWGVHRKQKK
ncbi:MAG: fibro-slime domain-containing protein [Fibrobacter sp.]|jgi:fibro-slime domain-containing protein|nr:fibro-slime domain-containing protein [Fibrobacter sp.]